VAARYATLGFEAVSTYSHRFYGVYSNPNTLGILSALAVPMGLGLWSYTKSRGYLLGDAIAFYSILLCESRTALLAVAAAAAVVVLRRGTSAVMTALAVLGAGAVIIGLSSSLAALPGPLQGVADRLGGGGPGGELTNRGAAWSKALSLWRDRPWSGYGFRTGDIVFANDPTGTFTRGMAHNSYLQIILELGVVGAVLAALLVTLLIGVVRRCPVVGLGGGLIGTVVAGLCAGLTESALWGSGAAFCWAFWLSGAAASCWASASAPLGGDDVASPSGRTSAPGADRQGTRASVRLSA
jgi:exopolysaccharide production protein ExoQ